MRRPISWGWTKETGEGNGYVVHHCQGPAYRSRSRSVSSSRSKASSQRSSNRTISHTREEPEEELGEEDGEELGDLGDEKEEDDSRLGDFDSPLPDKASESSREETAIMSEVTNSPKKKKNTGLPKIDTTSKGGVVKVNGTKNPVPKSPKKFPQVSPTKMPRKVKKESNNNGQESNDNETGITNRGKPKDVKSKKPLRKAETSLGLTEKAIKKKVEESFKNINNLNELKQGSRNMKTSKSESQLNDDEDDEISSLSGSIDLSSPEEPVLPSKPKPKKLTKDLSELQSPMKTKRPPRSPTKSKPPPLPPSKLSSSPSKRNLKPSVVSKSPAKSRKKFEKTTSVPNFANGDSDEDKVSTRSPKKKKPLKKQKSETSVIDNDGEESNHEEEKSEAAEPVLPKSPKKPKRSELVFSDEEQESPFGVSSGRGQAFRRTTYLDILKIEHERREQIKKMKEVKEKEREKRKLEDARKGIKAHSSKSVTSSMAEIKKSNAGLKSTEPDLPDQIEKMITDSVEKTPIISSTVNYNRNRESLVGMIRKKIKEDHFLKSLCMTDEWLMKNIIAVIFTVKTIFTTKFSQINVSFGPMMKLHTKTQVMVWALLVR